MSPCPNRLSLRIAQNFMVVLAVWLLMVTIHPTWTKPASAQTALDDYIAKPDPSFSWSLVQSTPGNGYTRHVVDLVSQNWRSSDEVDRTEWTHWLDVVIPDGVAIDTAMLHIAEGNNGASIPNASQMLSSGALAANSVMARLYTVPNQALRFSDENRARVEDEILAYSFDKFLSGGDEEWPALLPMVKSAVRAMDVVQQLVVDQTEGASDVEDFTVYGVSKRGWTTWLTAAVDTRVRAIVPTVIDILNFEVQFPHHKAFYEGVTDHIVKDYSWVMHDYVDSNAVDRLGTPRGQELQDITDPYRYRDRFESIPKLLINATGDEFFVPDGSQFYFDDLPGEKFLRYVPNANHRGFFETAVQFHQAVAADVDLPEFDWSIEDGGRRIEVTIQDTPLEVRMWEAHNPNSRDFRHSISTPPPVWHDTLLTDLGDGLYVGELPYPESGASAFMIELAFDSGGETPFLFTTDVSVIVPSRTTGDFDGDTLLSVQDLDLLSAEIAADEPRLSFDLNGDGRVDAHDRSFWIIDLKETFIGDTDLDRQVNAADLNALALNWRADDATSWAQGDFNGDGQVNATDLNDLALNWRSGVVQAASAVPEPSTTVLLLLGSTVMLSGRRRQIR